MLCYVMRLCYVIDVVIYMNFPMSGIDTIETRAFYMSHASRYFSVMEYGHVHYNIYISP